MAAKRPSTLSARLHRIEGQIRGVERLLDNKEPSEKVITQVEAVISSLESVKIQIIKNQLKDKLMEELDGIVDLIK